MKRVAHVIDALVINLFITLSLRIQEHHATQIVWPEEFDGTVIAAVGEERARIGETHDIF